jgi:prolyl oligopeptidase
MKPIRSYFCILRATNARLFYTGFLFVGIAVVACNGMEKTASAPPAAATVLEYPDSPRVNQSDDYHGTRVADPYRWLEDLDAAETRAWVVAQNALSMPYFKTLPARDRFARKLRALIDYERFGVPQHRAGRYVYTYNSGQQEQDVIWATENPAERGQVLLDPNQLRADGTISIGGYQLSPDGRKLAYSLSDGGSDWKLWRVVDVETGEGLGDELQGIKFSSVSWSADSAGFYYSRYPRSTGDNASNDYDDGQQVTIRYHALGTEQEADQDVYRVTDHPTRNPYATVTDDGRYLIINLFDGYLTNGIYYRSIRNGKLAPETIRLLDNWDARYDFLGNDGERFFFQTTLDAPLGRIVAIDLERPAPADWQTIVPEAAEAISSASLVGQTLIIQYIVDAHATAQTFNLSGDSTGEIVLPGKGTIEGFGGRAGDVETFFSYTDFATPISIYRYDLKSGQSTTINAPAVEIDTSVFTTKQVFYKSKDGTRVPMYIVHRKDLVPDGRLPVVLYGYGGFNVSLLPRYSTSRMAWLAAGGVYASANLRGGGEFGEAWHQSGIRLNKQNVFDDFIAAAEWLIENDYTVPDRLAIWGGSNGGLLVAAVANQRPDLFAAVVPAVGVLDMLRYHTASANARQWSSDYGLSENPDEFRAQLAYSPYHNLQPGECYPSMLVIADANDDRVVPWHSYKYAAALQQAQACAKPVLIRIETRAGHGAGASTTKIVDEYADQWAFVAQALKLDF